MKNPFKLIYKIIESSILCIRFPFLYPRNRFSGLHYNNWRIKNYCNRLVEKYSGYTIEEIFSKFGEKKFREYEAMVIKEVKV